MFRSCQVFEWLLVVHCFHLRDFQGRPEISHTIQNQCTRENIVTTRLLYRLESFNSGFARLETKLNVRSLLHHYELSQRCARYKNLKHD
jgi:hypothetical protein